MIGGKATEQLLPTWVMRQGVIMHHRMRYFMLHPPPSKRLWSPFIFICFCYCWVQVKYVVFSVVRENREIYKDVLLWTSTYLSTEMCARKIRMLCVFACTCLEFVILFSYKYLIIIKLIELNELIYCLINQN